MIHPSDTGPVLRSVRDGRSAPVTCSSCGCRLQAADETAATWLHFNPLAGRDARGCRVACADVAHDAAGQPLRDALLA